MQKRRRNLTSLPHALQNIHAAASRFDPLLIHRRQHRHHACSLFHIVKPGKEKICRNMVSLLLSSFRYTQCDLVIGADNCIRKFPEFFKQFQKSVLTRCDLIILIENTMPVIPVEMLPHIIQAGPDTELIFRIIRRPHDEPESLAAMFPDKMIHHG